MGVISKINSLRGIARNNYIKKWKIYTINRCRERGISLHQLGYSLSGKEEVIEFLKDICDDLTDNECADAIDELIREHGGLGKTEEEYEQMIEKYKNVEQLDPIRISEIVNEALKDMGESEGFRYRVINDILTYFNVEDKDSYLKEIVGTELKPVIKREVKEEEISIRKTRRKLPYVLVLDALSKYLIIGKPSINAIPVSGKVAIGRVNNALNYVVCPSKLNVVKVIEDKEDYAVIEVNNCYLETYGV